MMTIVLLLLAASKQLWGIVLNENRNRNSGKIFSQNKDASSLKGINTIKKKKNQTAFIVIAVDHNNANHNYFFTDTVARKYCTLKCTCSS